MLEVLYFAVAGAALGGVSSWLHDRKPSSMFLLFGLYTIAIGVCVAVGHANRLHIMTLITPYVLIAMGASLVTAFATIRRGDKRPKNRQSAIAVTANTAPGVTSAPQSGELCPSLAAPE